MDEIGFCSRPTKKRKGTALSVPKCPVLPVFPDQAEAIHVTLVANDQFFIARIETDVSDNP